MIIFLFRIFIMLYLELNAPDQILETINYQVSYNYIHGCMYFPFCKADSLPSTPHRPTPQCVMPMPVIPWSSLPEKFEIFNIHLIIQSFVLFLNYLGVDGLLQHVEHPAPLQGARLCLRLVGDCVPPRLHRSDPLPHPAAEGMAHVCSGMLWNNYLDTKMCIIDFLYIYNRYNWGKTLGRDKKKTCSKCRANKSFI